MAFKPAQKSDGWPKNWTIDGITFNKLRRTMHFTRKTLTNVGKNTHTHTCCQRNALHMYRTKSQFRTESVPSELERPLGLRAFKSQPSGASHKNELD